MFADARPAVTMLEILIANRSLANDAREGLAVTRPYKKTLGQGRAGLERGLCVSEHIMPGSVAVKNALEVRCLLSFRSALDHRALAGGKPTRRYAKFCKYRVEFGKTTSDRPISIDDNYSASGKLREQDG
jgi:hypothetical protein